jgi:hypothetical protein
MIAHIMKNSEVTTQTISQLGRNSQFLWFSKSRHRQADSEHVRASVYAQQAYFIDLEPKYFDQARPSAQSSYNWTGP